MTNSVEDGIKVPLNMLSLSLNYSLFLGWILIDRCGKHFGIILNFLRDGSAPLPESPRETAELLAEAKYYCVAELGKSLL